MSGKYHSDQGLEQAIAGWRTEAARRPESFSRAARSAVLREAIAPDARRVGPLDALFVPFRTLAAAGALPVIALSLLLGGLVFQGDSDPVDPTTGALTAMKVGNQVVFSIANGDRDHLVLRATRPEFDQAARFTASGGRFSERLDGDAELVFYRIE